MGQLTYTVKQKVKRDVEKMTCPTHGEHPTIIFEPKGIKVACCCEDFRKTIVSKCKQSIKEAFLYEFKKSLKGLR